MTDALGKILAGRAPGFPLNEAGHRQAASLAACFSPSDLDMISTSPLERTQQTAAYLASRCKIAFTLSSQLTEVDCGEWTGLTFGELEHDPRWVAFNRIRSVTRIPGGEMMLEVQERIVREMEMLRRASHNTIALVTHGDVIRAAVAYYAGISIDNALRITIDPASVTSIAFEPDLPRILAVNWTPSLPPFGTNPK